MLRYLSTLRTGLMPGVRWALLLYVALLAVAMLAVGYDALQHADGWAQRSAAKRAIDPAVVPRVGAWLLGFGIAALVLVATLRLRRAGLAAVLATVLLWTMYGLGLMPALDPYSSASAVMDKVRQRIGDGELGMVAWREQNLLQTHPQAMDFGFKRPWPEQWEMAGQWVAAAPERRWLFVLKQAMTPCADPAAVIDIGSANRNQWQLLPGTALDTACVAATHGQVAGTAGETDED